MTKNIVIFGTNLLADVVYQSIKFHRDERYNVLGFVVDDEYYSESVFMGKNVYRYSELDSVFDKEKIDVLICIGYMRMNEVREKIFCRIQSDGWGIADYIDKEAIVRTTKIGVGNIILDGVNISYGAEIGDGNIFHTNAVFGHHSEAGNFNFFCGSMTVAGNVKIGNNCFLGVGSIIRDGLFLNDKTLIGGGCFVNKDVTKPGQVYMAPRSAHVKIESSMLI